MSVLISFPNTKLADKVPSMKASGRDGIAKFTSEQVTKDFKTLINMCCAHPDFIGGIKDFGVSMVEKHLQEKMGASAPGQGSGEFTLGSVNELWLEAWIAKRTNITEDGLGKAKAGDPQSVRFLATRMLNASSLLTLGPDWKDQDLFFGALDVRWKDCLEPLKNVDDDMLLTRRANGKMVIDWEEIGHYEYEWPAPERPKDFGSDEEVYATGILHRDSGDVGPAPENWWITDDWFIKQNWNMDTAKAVTTGVAHELKDAFKKSDGAGPYQPSLAYASGKKGAQTLAKIMAGVKAKSDAAKARLAEEKIVANEAAFRTPTKEAHATAATKAMEAMRKRTAETEASRQCRVARPRGSPSTPSIAAVSPPPTVSPPSVVATSPPSTPSPPSPRPSPRLQRPSVRLP